MENLWEETICVLAHNGKTWADVKYICGDDFRISKENYEEVAKNTNYDDGFGAPEVAEDLQIIGEDWWLTRDEYDGSEYWIFHKKPDVAYMPVVNVKRLSVRGTDNIGWRTLKELNEEE